MGSRLKQQITATSGLLELYPRGPFHRYLPLSSSTQKYASKFKIYIDNCLVHFLGNFFRDMAISMVNF